MIRTIAGATFSEVVHDQYECRVERFVLETPLLVWSDCVAPMPVSVDHRESRRLSFTRRPNSFCLLGAGEYLNFHARGGATRVLMFQMPPNWYAPNMPERKTHAPAPRMDFHDAALSALMRLLAQHFSSAEPLGKLFSENLTEAIAGRIEDASCAEDGPRQLTPGLARTIQEWIEHRLEDPPSLAEMAALAGMGISLFGRAFRHRFDVTPHQYVLARRIERAKELLRSSQVMLTEIAGQLGFANHAHFSATFRARVGQTPSSYRQAAARSLPQVGGRSSELSLLAAADSTGHRSKLSTFRTHGDL